MDRRFRAGEAAPPTDPYSRDAEVGDWDADPDEARRPRRGFFGSLAALVKFGVFALPVTLFLYGSFADCSARPAAGWLGLVGAGACARTAMLGSVLSMQDTFALLGRILD